MKQNKITIIDGGVLLIILTFGTFVIYPGKNSFTWIGPVPRINIMDPAWVRQILNNSKEFQKSDSNPLTKLLAAGVATYEGDKWAKHRKLLNPAFHQEKLKVITINILGFLRYEPCYLFCPKIIYNYWTFIDHT